MRRWWVGSRPSRSRWGPATGGRDRDAVPPEQPAAGAAGRDEHPAVRGRPVARPDAADRGEREVSRGARDREVPVRAGGDPGARRVPDVVQRRDEVVTVSLERCEVCGGADVTYAAFSGGREYWCGIC